MAMQSLTVAILLAVFLSLQLAHIDSLDTEVCMPGKYHKKTPSKETADFKACHAWKDKSCCTANFTVEISRHRVKNLWNFHWDHCSNLSQACDKYLVDEECFWQCDPNLIKWHTGKGTIKRVPICSKYCDDWFDACKNDLTCVSDWLSDFNFTANSYICPRDSKCLTYAERYKNGEGLCNKMWGSSFKYEKTSNCMLMDFKGANPNDKVVKVVNSGRTVTSLAIYVLVGQFFIFFLV